MTSKLLVYWAPTHGQPDESYFRALQPANILVLDPDVSEISRAFSASPESLFTLRRWEWDDNRSDGNPHGVYGRLRDDPVGLAAQHVDQFTAWFSGLDKEARRRGLPFPQREQLVASLVNEPDSNTLLRQINDYTVAACDGFRKQGIVAEALKLGTGHPAILNANGEPDWGPLAGALAAIVRGNHIAVTHEYYNTSGIQHPDMHPWHVGRTAKWAPRGPRYLIGEFGLEQLVNGKEAQHHGWMGRISAEQMAADTDWYLSQQRDDCIGARLFLTDFADRIWASFNTLDAHPQLIEVGKRHPSGKRPSGPSQPDPAPEQGGNMSIIEPRAAAAVLDVESGGEGFGPGGRLKIRFEAHIFKRELGNDALWARHFQHGSPIWTGHYFRRNETDPWQAVHTGDQAAEWAAFDLACELHAEAAYQSISMGAAQIMGFNANRVGYASALAMFRAFERSLGHQMIAFVNYILSDDDLYEAMLGHDWRTIARLYNGTGAVDHYAQLLAERYAQLG